MTKTGQGQAHSFAICSVDSVDQSSGLQDLRAERGQDEAARKEEGQRDHTDEEPLRHLGER